MAGKLIIAASLLIFGMLIYLMLFLLIKWDQITERRLFRNIDDKLRMCKKCGTIQRNTRLTGISLWQLHGTQRDKNCKCKYFRL